MAGGLRVRASLPNWENDARFVVDAVQADGARARAVKAVAALVDELCRLSLECEAMWWDNDGSYAYEEIAKQVEHPVVGTISLEYSAFAVDGRPDLCLVIYNPATPEDRAKVGSQMRPPQHAIPG